jgi:hypothetical protein
MALRATYWERRDNADREALGNSAYDFCRSARGVEGIRNCRFYWSNADTIVILSDAESPDVFDRPGTPEVGKAAFALADLARTVRDERWIEPREGVEAYRRAGR